MHSHRAIGFATAVLIVGACSDATGTSDTQPVVIDGLRGQHEWDDATSVQAFSGATFLYKTGLIVIGPLLAVNSV